MNLIWFLTIALIFSITLGELGQYPFGTTVFSISVTDILLLITLIFLAIWKIGITKSIAIKHEFIPLFVFWFIATLSLLISGKFEGGLYLVRFIFYSSTFILGFYLINSKVVNSQEIARIICLNGFILSIIGFLQLLFFPDLKYLTDFGYDPHINRLTSTFLDPNFSGAFISITATCGVYLYIQSKSKTILFLTLIQMLAVFLTYSRSAYLMIGVILLIYGILKSRKLLLGLLITTVCLLIFVPRFTERIVGAINVDKSASERLVSWQIGLNLFTQNPLIGVGFNNVRYVLSENNLFKSNMLDGGNAGSGIDSSFLLILVTTGIIGFVSFILFLILVTKKIKNLEIFNIAIFSIIIGLIINSQFINSLFYPPIMLVFYLLLGVAMARI